MTQGFERRDVIQDANSKSRAVNPASIPVTSVMRPTSSNFSRVGESGRKLAAALGGAGELLDKQLMKYADKKMDQWNVEGQMLRAEGKTEQEVYESGNRFTRAGWQSMDAKIAGDELYHNELASIAETGKTMTSQEYQSYLGGQFTGLQDQVSGYSQDVKDMSSAYALDMYPKLVAEQIRQNNKYNKEQTLEKGRKLIVSTAETDGVDAAKDVLDNQLYNLSTDDYNTVVASAIGDGYSLGSDNVVQALIGQKRDEGTPVSKQYSKAHIAGTLNVIGDSTSGNDYTNTAEGNVENLTSMTLDEAQSKYTAIGKYMIPNDTLDNLKSKLGISGDTVLTEELQDTLAASLLDEAGVAKYLDGVLTEDEFQGKLTKIWPNLPSKETNNPNVEPGKITQALAHDKDNVTLYSKLVDMGMKSDDINRVMKAREAYQVQQSSKFEAARIISEERIKEQAIDLSTEDLISTIKDVKEAGGYSDAWANKLFTSSLGAKKAAEKERKAATKIHTMISTNSAALGTKKEQQQAIDLVVQQAMQANPEATDPNSPNQRNAATAAMDRVYKFMYNNGIVDDRLKSQWEVATMGDIVDGNGRVKPAAIDAYSGYLQAKSSVNDPLFASTLLSDKTKDLFIMADSYSSSNSTVDPEQALAAASTFLEKENSAKGVNNLPWWKDYEQTAGIESDLRDNVIPGLLDGFFGYSDSQAQMRWSINEDAVTKAATSPEVTNRIKQEAAKLWTSMKHRPDQDAAKSIAVTRATNKVLAKSEYVAGSMVYSGDQPTIAERIGMGGVKNAANMVASRVMSELGPDIWENFNQTDIYTMSQNWYEEDSQGLMDYLGKGAEFVAKVATSPLELASGAIDKGFEKARGIPDFQVMLNKGSNALVISPYTNYGRTQTSTPYVLSIENMKEAAKFLDKKDEVGFKKWIEEQRQFLPRKLKE